MKPGQRAYWTKEKCILSASGYQSIKEWIQGEKSGAYYAAWNNGWLEECTAHMEKRKPNGYWTKENCMVSALKYTSPREWMRKESAALNCAWKKGWYRECTMHMDKKKPKGYWTKENCMKSAREFDSKNEWKKRFRTAYFTVCRNGWIKECTAHMETVERHFNGFWTKERCIADALKYNTVSEWQRSSKTACSQSSRKGWYAECTAHMIRLTPGKKSK